MCTRASSAHEQPCVACKHSQCTPYHRAQLTAEVDREAANEDENEDNEDEHGTSTTRSFVCELQRLGVPGTSGPAEKLQAFRDQITELSKSHTRWQSYPSNI